ncbi:hypothetical protein ACU4GD_22830 [Cupriavidus basilensis]
MIGMARALTHGVVARLEPRGDSQLERMTEAIPAQWAVAAYR